MRNEAFRSAVGSETATVKVMRDGESVEIELTSTDELLGVYEGTVGVKTGTTDLAGACFAGANDHDGGEYYAIVLDSSDSYQRFTDTQTLWDWCYEHQKSYQLAHAPSTVNATIGGVTADYPVMATVGHADWLDRSVTATIADPSAAVGIFELDGNVSQEASFDDVRGNVKAGDKVGTLVFKQRNQEIASVDLVAAEDVAPPDPFTGIGIWWQRLWGNDQVAESQLLNTTPVVIDKTQTVASANG
jgi:D-alanyl-D-alanine carboxypeptidase (penicillin-binding protein 5/6)